MDRARRRELKHAGVLAARRARVDLATTIEVLEKSGSGDEGRQLAGRLSFAVGALYGAEVGEPEGVRDRLREASGVLSGVLARLSEPGVPRALDDAGASVAKCLAVLYPARAGLERELEASATEEGSGEAQALGSSEPLSSPLIPLPAREAPAAMTRLEPEAAAPAREKKITQPGIAPPSSPMIPVSQLVAPSEPSVPEPPARERGGRVIPATREHALRVSARTLIRGTDDWQPAPPPSAEREGASGTSGGDVTKISQPPPALLREATPGEASTFVGAVPLGKRKRKKALELVPDADEGLVERSSGSPVNDGSERRTTERVSLEADIGLHSATNFFTGLSGDVSHGGVFVATWAPLPLGTEVTVSFVLPGGHQVTAAGRVAWLKDPQASSEEATETPGMGVRFTGLSDTDQRAIEEFLARRPAMFHEV